MMLVVHILDSAQKRLAKLQPQSGVCEAAALLLNRETPLIVVCDQAGVTVGVVSRTDVIKTLARADGDLLSMRVEDIMTRGVLSCRPHQPLRDVWKSLNDWSLRCAPILDANARPQGVIQRARYRRCTAGRGGERRGRVEGLRAGGGISMRRGGQNRSFQNPASEPRQQKIHRRENHFASLSQAPCRNTEIAPGDGCQLRRHQQVAFALESQKGCEVIHRLAGERASLAERNDNSRLQIFEKIRLHVDEQRKQRFRSSAFIPIDRELRHQNRRTSSENTPCLSI